MTRQTKRRVLIVVLAAALLSLLALWLRPEPLPVDTAAVERGLLRVTVDEQGRTRARYRYTVAAPVTGRVLRTHLDEGDRVDEGDVLVHIAPPPENSRTVALAEAELGVAIARENEAQALLEEAAANNERASGEASRRAQLYRRGLVGSEERDRYARIADSAAARVAGAVATLDAARAGVAAARARLLGVGSNNAAAQLVRVPAPVSGRVLRVFEESERVVPAGTPLLELSRGDTLELVVDFLTEDAVKVRAGQDIIVTGWGGDAPLAGSVRYVEPGAFTKISTLGVEEQRVNVIGDLDRVPAGLGAEFRIEAAIVTWEGHNVLRVPAGALFRHRGAWQVFVVSDGRATRRTVETGRRGGEYVQVTGGLDEGEAVIVFPSDRVTDGVRVVTGR